jgi:hypothetical protein
VQRTGPNHHYLPFFRCAYDAIGEIADLRIDSIFSIAVQTLGNEGKVSATVSIELFFLLWLCR